MCGIAGFYRGDVPADRALIETMCARMRHRGPDDQGIHLDGSCAIGMRRLSIIDLAGGRQPIANEDESIWIVFNGEIYNHHELRRELEAKGHRFRTNSDTESIVHLYEEEGEDAFKRLRGMFGIAIWDTRTRRLILARDRFGKKPLYYAAGPWGVYFASELKCLLGLDIPYELDREALKPYFRFGYLLDPETPYRAVRKLRPGCSMSCAADGTVEERRYWQLPPPAESPPPGLSQADARLRLRELFDEAVRVRMEADVPLGAFLSGGLDSSSIVASMALQSNAPVKTVSIGWEESDLNELPLARLVAEKYRTEHREVIVRPDCVELIPRVLRQFDEPFADSSAVPTYIVSHTAVESVKVALTGDGGDELFAGYTSARKLENFRVFDKLPAFARKVLAWSSAALPYSAYGKNYLHCISRPRLIERYFEYNYPGHAFRKNLLEPEWMLPADEAFLEGRLREYLPLDDADALTELLYFEARANLPGDMLVKVDRMSMANSLEVRCPLLDHKLAEFAATLPHSWKIRGERGKAILIDALGDRLPAELLTAPKRGFAVPLAAWFRGPLREYLRDHLTSRSFSERGIVSPKFVDYLLDEHERGRRDNHGPLWALLSLEQWFREARL